MKLKYLLVLPITMLGFPLAACNSNKNKITVAEVTHSIFYAPLYVAKNKGFFKEEGLDINIITTPGADKTMASLLSKDSQIGLMGPEASVYVYNKKQKDYAINFAQLTQKDGSFLLGREKIDNFNYTMLKGKTVIGGRKGGMPLMILEHILRKNNIDFGENDPNKDVNIRTDVSFDAMSGVFVSGQSDFVTAFEPVATQVETLKKGYIVTSLGQDSGNIPYTCFSTLKSYMQNNKSTLTKFSTAITKGLNYVLSNDVKDIIPFVKDDFTSSTDEELSKVLTNYKNIEAWPNTPSFNKESFEKLLTIIKEAGELDKNAYIPYEDLVTNEYIN